MHTPIPTAAVSLPDGGGEREGGRRDRALRPQRCDIGGPASPPRQSSARAEGTEPGNI